MYRAELSLLELNKAKRSETKLHQSEKSKITSCYNFFSPSMAGLGLSISRLHPALQCSIIDRDYYEHKKDITTSSGLKCG